MRSQKCLEGKGVKISLKMFNFQTLLVQGTTIKVWGLMIREKETRVIMNWLLFSWIRKTSY
jgi:hypothetical protein